MKMTRCILHFRYCASLAILVWLLLISHVVAAQRSGSDSSFKAHTDLLYSEEKSLYQDFYITSPKDGKVDIQFQCYFYRNENDSLLVYRQKKERQRIKKGVNTLKVKFEDGGSGNYVLSSLGNAVKNSGSIPAGSYKILLSLKSGRHIKAGFYTGRGQQLCNILLFA